MKYEFNTPPAVVTYGKAGKAKYFAKLLEMEIYCKLPEPK